MTALIGAALLSGPRIIITAAYRPATPVFENGHLAKEIRDYFRDVHGWSERQLKEAERVIAHENAPRKARRKKK